MSVTKHQGQGCGGHCCLKIEHLGVKIGSDEILRDVNLHIHCGEIVALIGPNGAGKSTLIRSILGQREHDGTITFQPAGEKTRKFRIGYVPQSPSFSGGDPVSVLDLFVASTSNWPIVLPIPKGLKDFVAQCLERVNGLELLHKQVGALSGGELQRVLLAMALEPVPNILILDEPLSGVDMDGERQLLALLDEIRTRYDLSILISTHDFNTLHKMDKVILLKQKVLQMGTPEEVLASQEFQTLFYHPTQKGGDAQ